MKPFNLEEYLKNPKRKVVTRDGRKVRILCTDAKIDNTHTILTLVEEPNGSESIVPYPDGGQFYAYKPTKVDIFFAPEKHEGWGVICGSFLTGEIFTAKEEAEEFVKRAQSKDFVAIAKIEWEE